MMTANERAGAARELPPVKKRTIHDALPRGPAALKGKIDLNPPRWQSSPGAKDDLPPGWYFEKSKGPPDLRSPQRSKSVASRSSSSSGIWERLWDPKQFTGTHKHRFDVETGKGLGKSGRLGGTVKKVQKFKTEVPHLDPFGGCWQPPTAAAPRMLVCYLCGTMHGVCSLIHHHGPCALRRHRSDMPDASDPPTVPIPEENANRAECEAYNEAAQAAYESAMPYCRVCTRTFATPEKLRKHEKCCIQVLDKSFYKPRGMTGRHSPARPTSPQRGRGYGPGYQRQGKEFVDGISL